PPHARLKERSAFWSPEQARSAEAALSGVEERPASSSIPAQAGHQRHRPGEGTVGIVVRGEVAFVQARRARILVAEAERVARARAAGVTLHAGHERLAALDRIGVEDVRAVGFLAGEVAAAGLDAREVAARGRAVVARRTCSAGSSRARARAEQIG